MTTSSLELFVVATLLVTIAYLLIIPATDWKNGGAIRVLFVQGCSLGLVFAPGLWSFVTLWAVAPLATLPKGREKLRSAFFWYQTLSSVLLVAFALRRLVTADGSSSTFDQCLFVTAVWIRLGLFPFHASTLSLIEQTSLDRVVPFLSSQMGAVALFQMSSSSFFFENGIRETLICLSIVGAIYFGLLATVQSHPRRLVGLVSLVGTSLGVVGFLLGDKGTSAPIAMQWYSVILFTAGLGSVTWMLQSRVGTFTGGLASSVPAIATFFLLFGLAAGGFPGSIGFVIDEMFMGAHFPLNELFGVIFIPAASLVVIASYRMFSKTFQGVPTLQVDGIDLKLRERLGLLLLLGALIYHG